MAISRALLADIPPGCNPHSSSFSVCSTNLAETFEAVAAGTLDPHGNLVVPRTWLNSRRFGRLSGRSLGCLSRAIFFPSAALLLVSR